MQVQQDKESDGDEGRGDEIQVVVILIIALPIIARSPMEIA